MNQVDSFRQIATVLRAAQRAAIHAENAPDERKRLRSFPFREAAGLLGLSPASLKQAILGRPCLDSAFAKARLTLTEVLELRHALHDPGSGKVFSPRRMPERGEKLATLMFTNFKGGSAKTTSSVHCAQYLALSGYRVLLVDLDSQGSATAQFGIDPASEVGVGNSFATWISARDTGAQVDAHGLCQATYWPSIDLLPAGAVLAVAEESLSRRSLAGSAGGVPYFDELGAFLAEVQDQYDVAVVDTRPDVNMLMTTALHAATGVIVPTRATMTDLASTGEFFAHLASYVADVQAAFGRGLDCAFTKILVSAYDPMDRSQEALLGLVRDHFGTTVLPAPFLHSRVMGTAGFGKETIYEYEPTTDRAAYSRVLASVNAVNGAIEREVQAAWGRSPGQRTVGAGT